MSTDGLLVDACVVANPAGAADLIESRLRALGDRVDLCVVLVHGKTDALESARFTPWRKKLLVANLAKSDGADDNDDDEWAREKRLRDTLPGVLRRLYPAERLGPRTVVLLSNEDELPDPRVVRATADAVRDRYGAMSFRQQIYCRQFAWRLRHAWCGTVATTADRLLRHGAQFFRDGRDGWDAVVDGGVRLAGFGGRDDAVDGAHRERASPPEWWPDGFMPDAWFVVPDDSDDEQCEPDPPLPT